MDVLAIVRLLDAIVNLSLTAGISLAKYQELKAQSGGVLTEEQIKKLAEDTQKAIDDL